MSRQLIGVGLVLLLGCDRTSLELSEAHAAAIRDSVQATLSAFRQYAATGQWDSVLLLYADEPPFQFVENGKVRYHSVAEIRQALRSLPPGMRIQTTHHGTEITPLAPGIASVATEFHTEFMDSAGTTTFSVEGAATLTLVHRAAGWRILNGHSSSPAPGRP